MAKNKKKRIDKNKCGNHIDDALKIDHKTNREGGTTIPQVLPPPITGFHNSARKREKAKLHRNTAADKSQPRRNLHNNVPNRSFGDMTIQGMGYNNDNRIKQPPLATQSPRDNEVTRSLNSKIQKSQQQLLEIMMQLQNFYYGIILERLLVCKNTCNKDGVEILTGCGGQPPKPPYNSVVINYDCFENEKTELDYNCCNPNDACEKLMDKLKILKSFLKDVFIQFIKSASPEKIFNVDVVSIVKACVVSHVLEGIVEMDQSDNHELHKTFVKVTLRTIINNNPTNAREFLVSASVNALTKQLELKTLNTMLSEILKKNLTNILRRL